MKYIFGPVNSRRFGISLGIDLSPEVKSCNFDCLYCELERAKPVPRMRNEADTKEIIAEVKEYIRKNGYPDVITVTANGEPTLYPKLDALIDRLNYLKGNSKTLILSNGSTIKDKKMQEILSKFDIVKISLDAVDQKTFEKINRVLKGIYVKDIIEGLKEFRKIFKGELIVEILLVRYINDSIDNILKTAEILKDIKPDRVDLGTVDRPPAYRVYPLSDEELFNIARFFDGLNINVISRGKDSIEEKISLSEEQIIKTIKRRPYTYQDIQNIFDDKTVQKVQKLIKEGILKETRTQKEIFITT
ncbi:Wyosine [tRNA(Phe)-imidazoG37] synthetase, radical SAM superfamily [Persephonella hydrogeniphila]|uniref:Wyosine [tRNA(Phe)-imidazoG37] synthetase, radical SAM superfamily n=1 Tax=Persephonella hydrogeniphila TaxID=198703 RepID=A0A285MYR2_9AQUI|nr:radical SAM protein [Persephonella hydrogeniphila]SNZ02238.1 Wyosine [tRNA(Phe)-imidazoG37] synthetase, radical SAM superfamily [Persephonella hydrogeniphila]